MGNHPAGTSEHLWQCHWWEDMLPLKDVVALGGTRFGIDRTRRSFQNVLLDLDIKATHRHVDRDSGRGQVGYYDPLVLWAVFVAIKSGVDRPVLRDRFADALVTASRAVWRDFGGSPDSAPEHVRLEWQWRCQATAVHLFITDPRHGLRPIELVEARHAQLHRFTLDSPECLGDTLNIYMDVLRSALDVRHHDAARLVTSDEFHTDRESQVLASLDRHGVLRASERRLGRRPVARKVSEPATPNVNTSDGGRN